MDRGIFLTSIIMSRFNTLLKGLSETAPQIKGSLKNWAEELKILQANPAGNERRIQELSDNIRSTVEANATREGKLNKYPEQQRLSNQPEITKSTQGDILIAGEGKPAANLIQEAKTVKPLAEAEKKAAAFAPMMQSPFAQGNPQEQLERGVSDTAKKLVGQYMPDSSPENKALAEKAINVVGNPMNYVGGTGLADLAMGAVEVAPEAYDAAKARFKGLFGGGQ